MSDVKSQLVRINREDEIPRFLNDESQASVRAKAHRARVTLAIRSDWGKRSQAVREPVGWTPELSQAVGRAE